MTFETVRKQFDGDAPGHTIELNYFRIGSKSSAIKVYLQAALHADEQPGIMILHHLLPMLIAADEADELNAEFVVFPMVNPLGMGNILFRHHHGRYHWPRGVNFNRQWPDLYEVIRETIQDRLGMDERKNIQLVRQAVYDWLEKLEPVDALQQQQKIIMLEAFDADYVLDLHCDNDALPHIYTSPHLVPESLDLSDWIGAAATLTSEDSGGASFDEVWSGMWNQLIRNFPEKALTHATFSATLEYRGNFDVFDELNKQDALNLYGFFQGRGLIGGHPKALRPARSKLPTDLAATDLVRVKQSGLLAYKVELGEVVEKGQTIADLIALDGEGAFFQRIPIVAETNGLVISRNSSKYVWPGCSVAKIVGTEILESRGQYLVED